MDCCCCCGDTVANSSAAASNAGIGNTILADTVGLLWRGATGTVDPWTKAELQANESAGLQQAGACACCAEKTSNTDVTCTLKSTPGGSSCPNDAYSGLIASLKKATCLTNNLGTTILFIGIGALLLLIVFNRVVGE